MCVCVCIYRIKVHFVSGTEVLLHEQAGSMERPIMCVCVYTG